MSLLAAILLAASLPVEPSLAREVAGSYRIAPDHVIDIGPMDEAGGALMFVDQKTRRSGLLQQVSTDVFTAGPSLGKTEPEDIRFKLLRDSGRRIRGAEWSGEGLRSKRARKIAQRVDHDVTVQNGATILKGILSVPAEKGPHPAILFAHGSGDTKRNVGAWNMFFVRLGFAVLSLDKRGVGESTGDWKTSSMEDLASDLLSAVDFLKQRTDIDAARIGIHGSSQGGWTAPLAASRSKDIAFVIVRAGSGTTVRDTMLHEIEWSVREQKFSDAEAQEARRAAAAAFDATARNSSWNEFSEIVSPYKKKKWAESAWPLGMTESGWGRPWVGKNWRYDSTEAFRKVNVPVLLVLGELDHNVPTASSVLRLRSALAHNRNVRIVRIPNAGHSFLETTTGNNSEFPDQNRFAAGYWNTMEKWLAERR